MMRTGVLKLEWPRLSRHAALRALTAGSAWGIMFAGGMMAYALTTCGFVCLEDAALMTATSVAGGILTIGPLAAFGRAR